MQWIFIVCRQQTWVTVMYQLYWQSAISASISPCYESAEGWDSCYNYWDSCFEKVIRAVLTNGHNGHVPRAPGFFFLFEVPPTGCGEINFWKLIILFLMLLHDRTNTSSAYLVNLHAVVHGYRYCTGSFLLSLVYCVFCFYTMRFLGRSADNDVIAKKMPLIFCLKLLKDQL